MGVKQGERSDFTKQMKQLLKVLGEEVALGYVLNSSPASAPSAERVDAAGRRSPGGLGAGGLGAGGLEPGIHSTCTARGHLLPATPSGWAGAY